MSAKVAINANINGQETQFLCEPRQSLLEVLRDELLMTGVKEGCNNGNCGACNVILNGVLVNSCLVLAVEANDSSLIYTTHAPERAIGYAQTVICLRDGRLLHHGAVDELYHRSPTFEAATCLGATNWLSAHDRAAWFSESDTNACVRPERIIVEPMSTGTAIVQSAQFHGHLASVEVLRDDDNAARFCIGQVARLLLASA